MARGTIIGGGGLTVGAGCEALLDLGLPGSVESAGCGAGVALGGIGAGTVAIATWQTIKVVMSAARLFFVFFIKNPVIYSARAASEMLSTAIPR